IPVYKRDPETLMLSVEATDDRTLVIHWKAPYYGANQLLFQQLDPLPQHVLATKYESNKPEFLNGPEWTTSYIGSGPFRLERWAEGQEMVASAFGDWVLGPPKSAELDIRFVPDSQAALASLLAGQVDLSGLPWITPTQAD